MATKSMWIGECGTLAPLGQRLEVAGRVAWGAQARGGRR